MRTDNFASILHAKIYTLEKSITFKGKCAVNAENFKCNLQTGPLTKMIFEGRQTMLNARAFQQCIAS